MNPCGFVHPSAASCRRCERLRVEAPLVAEYDLQDSDEPLSERGGATRCALTPAQKQRAYRLRDPERKRRMNRDRMRRKREMVG